MRYQHTDDEASKFWRDARNGLDCCLTLSIGVVLNLMGPRLKFWRACQNSDAALPVWKPPVVALGRIHVDYLPGDTFHTQTVFDSLVPVTTNNGKLRPLRPVRNPGAKSWHYASSHLRAPNLLHSPLCPNCQIGKTDSIFVTCYWQIWGQIWLSVAAIWQLGYRNWVDLGKVWILFEIAEIYFSEEITNFSGKTNYTSSLWVHSIHKQIAWERFGRGKLWQVTQKTFCSVFRV